LLRINHYNETIVSRRGKTTTGQSYHLIVTFGLFGQFGHVYTLFSISHYE
jgi:hypothetical protein